MDHSELAQMQGPDSLFAGLAPQDWDDLAARAVRVTFTRGKELLAQGESGDKLLILTSGSARVALMTANGREIILAYADPGAVLGEIALLDGGERTASVLHQRRQRAATGAQRAQGFCRQPSRFCVEDDAATGAAAAHRRSDD